MALAWLSQPEESPSGIRFTIDIGANSYYRYVLGDAEQVTQPQGVRRFASAGYVSPLMHLLPAALGRGVLTVPAAHFSGLQNAIQLLSYRTSALEGVAISAIVPYQTGLLGNTNGRSRVAQPQPTFPMMTSPRSVSRPVQAFTFREAQYTHSMAAEGILGLLGGLLPALGTLLSPAASARTAGQRLPPARPAVPVAGAGGLVEELLRMLQNPAVLATIRQVLTAVAPAPGSSPAVSTPAVAETASVYAEAKVLPAVLGALTAVAPLLEKVLSPEVMKSVVESVSPTKMLSTLVDAIRGMSERELQHIEMLMPNTDHVLGSAERILGQMSLSQQDQTVAIPFAPTSAFSFTFEASQTTKLVNRTVVPFRAGQAITIPIRITIPKPVAKALVQVILKEADTLRVLVDKKFRLTDVTPGEPARRLTFSPDELKPVQVGKDVLVCVSLLVKNRKNQTIGVRKTHSLMLFEEYLLGSVGAKLSADLPLNDLHKHRAFWHKVYEKLVDDNQRRTEMDVKYYYTLAPRAGTNHLIETRHLLTEKNDAGNHRLAGKLKAGMGLSPTDLNNLIPVISTYPALSPAQLTALTNDEVAARFSLAGRDHLELKGRGGDSVALWVYPEVALFTFTLRKALATDENGQITRFADETVYFPAPVAMHFIGTKTGR